MFSPHDSPAVNDWFRRFDAASRRLPAAERASQREEIQQHLEGLVAAKVAQGQPNGAAWEAALRQFGDPTQIGRKMYQEWQQSRTGLLADLRAIFFGVGLLALKQLGGQLLYVLWFNRLYNSGDRLYTHGQGMVGFASLVNLSFACGTAILVNFAIGRKYPSQAIKAAFYADILLNLWIWGSVTAAVFAQHGVILQRLSAFFASAVFAHAMLLGPLFSAGSVTIAYLASVTKRGWYKPTLADFKLTLPRRRSQPSR